MQICCQQFSIYSLICHLSQTSDIQHAKEGAHARLRGSKGGDLHGKTHQRDWRRVMDKQISSEASGLDASKETS